MAAVWLWRGAEVCGKQKGSPLPAPTIWRDCAGAGGYRGALGK